ncbi:2156_t:CDS:2, partial [Cetraspora pellucida]
MSKHHEIHILLVDLGSLVDTFHYGQKTCTKLNGHDFYISIQHGNRKYAMLPEFQCQCSEFSSTGSTTSE